MRKISLAFFVIVLLSLAAFNVMSQLQMTPKISLEEKETCQLVNYDEVKDVIGECSETRNVNHCLNTSGPNTDCSLHQETLNWTCKTGTQTVQKQKNSCSPHNKYEIVVDNVKKELDFSSFGPCAYEVENNCLVVTCVSEHDGAHNGQFVGCKSGMSCQKMKICENSVEQFVHARDKFVKSDADFLWDHLELKEVTP